ncbi:hypothetical protein V8D89_003292 [Ganoderma adspersum]
MLTNIQLMTSASGVCHCGQTCTLCSIGRAQLMLMAALNENVALMALTNTVVTMQVSALNHAMACDARGGERGVKETGLDEVSVTELDVHPPTTTTVATELDNKLPVTVSSVADKPDNAIVNTRDTGASGFQSPWDRLESVCNRLERAADDLGEASKELGNSFDRLGDCFDRLGNSFDRLATSVERIGDAFSGMRQDLRTDLAVRRVAAAPRQ